MESPHILVFVQFPTNLQCQKQKLKKYAEMLSVLVETISMEMGF